MDDALLSELVLGCIPQRVVSVGVFEFFKRVEVRAFILFVLGEGGFCPLGEGIVFSVVFHHGTVNEANVSPGDDLVEEGFNRFWKTPPTLATPVVGSVDHADIPAVMGENVVKDGVNADVAVMQPRREPACSPLLRLVSFFVIGLEAFSKELLPATAAFNVAAFLTHHGLNIVVDGQGGEGFPSDVPAL